MAFDPHEARDILGRWTKGGGIPNLSVSVHSSGRVHIQSPYNKQFVSEVRNMGGRWNPKTKTWSVPGEKALDLDDLLAAAYGEPKAAASVHSEVDRSTAERAALDAKSVLEAELPRGVSITAGTNSKGEALIMTHTPFSDGFRTDARKLGAQWNSRDRGWMFKESQRHEVGALLKKHFGTSSGSVPTPTPDRGMTTATPRQIEYAWSMVARAARSGVPVGTGPGELPTYERLSKMSKAAVSELIDRLKEQY
jgi:hypothetical protein